MRRRWGFSLIEVLLVMAILFILSAMVYPVLADIERDSRTTAMAASVRDIREQIALHAALGTRPRAPSGFPAALHASWFAGGELPVDLWTGRPLTIEVVDGPADRLYPDSRAFELTPDGATSRPTAWYNSANGSFCVRVPRAASDTETLALFHRVNEAAAGAHAAGSGETADTAH
jgi:prepilin-type N-terminal cleavage/methylation domain-containing protein